MPLLHLLQSAANVIVPKRDGLALKCAQVDEHTCMFSGKIWDQNQTHGLAGGPTQQRRPEARLVASKVEVWTLFDDERVVVRKWIAAQGVWGSGR